ncbi:hypothetical protein [Thermocoleostomius sinensis]|uniref:Uncharacterized protein n=1 Tax=Thermocoleostomius sinensis A174 TaxID=2016057 RepID=A0A9E9C3E1_9CYAN|nr:hypothetical protein [Thermocoleostomius sinensis]WAL58876.1 hypothetical protein OXH18_17075 [Thermocoleostomius sinensis A174]
MNLTVPLTLARSSSARQRFGSLLPEEAGVGMKATPTGMQQP